MPLRYLCILGWAETLLAIPTGIKFNTSRCFDRFLGIFLLIPSWSLGISQRFLGIYSNTKYHEVTGLFWHALFKSPFTPGVKNYLCVISSRTLKLQVSLNVR